VLASLSAGRGRTIQFPAPISVHTGAGSPLQTNGVVHEGLSPSSSSPSPKSPGGQGNGLFFGAAGVPLPPTSNGQQQIAGQQQALDLASLIHSQVQAEINRLVPHIVASINHATMQTIRSERAAMQAELSAVSNQVRDAIGQVSQLKSDLKTIYATAVRDDDILAGKIEKLNRSLEAQRKEIADRLSGQQKLQEAVQWQHIIARQQHQQHQHQQLQQQHQQASFRPTQMLQAPTLQHLAVPFSAPSPASSSQSSASAQSSTSAPPAFYLQNPGPNAEGVPITRMHSAPEMQTMPSRRPNSEAAFGSD
jgi:hypothetical protein